VTRAIAAILHQRGRFLQRINKQYDPQYSQEGQRHGGGSIKIRMPNQYTVRTGTVMDVQDTTEASETMTIGTMKGVDLNFSDTDLALSIEDFTKRFINPAVAALVSNIEADIIVGACNGVANMVDNDGAAFSFLNIMQARQKLIEGLVPDDEDELSLFLTPSHNTKYVDAVKGLFAPAGRIGQQYQEGMVGPVAGVGWVGTSTHLTDLTTGTGSKGDTLYNVNPGSQVGAAITVDTGTITMKKGEVVTLAGCNAVHPETKVDLGYLKQFVLTADHGASFTTLNISPSIVVTGGGQNVTASPTNGGAVSKIGAGNGELLNRTLYFHRDFCAVAFADLENPKKYGAWGDVQVLDGVSVRLWRQGDITNGAFPTRLDVLYGYKVIRPQLACRIHADG
jgi:hypothetical protein